MKTFFFTFQIRWIIVQILLFHWYQFHLYMQLSTERIEIPYILLVYEADKFCNLVMNDSLFDQLSSIQSLYPAYTVCYLTNRLLAYINKKWVIYYNFLNTSILPAISRIYVLAYCAMLIWCVHIFANSSTAPDDLILGFNQTPKTN